ncbi:MAG: alpha/beta hydrolase [Candidatus Heimdallarchaeota archaeon]|nr:alpha/beta hydrolase [Candidatus Heimdallarchaeota archaeon]MDH5646510.1 alpha/beta hydrolase [Candidatus Heimdallarchaeota archaeon]
MILIDHPMISNMILFPRKEQLKSNTEKNILPISLEMKDGIKLTGLFFSAKEDKGTILFFHGNAEIANDYLSSYKLYTSTGYNLAVMDYRGYGSSEGVAVYSALFNDAPIIFNQLMEFLKIQNMKPSIIVMGRSLGGTSASAIGSINPNGLKAIIFESAYYDFLELVTDLFHQGIENAPSELLDAIKAWSNSKYIPLIKVPTLIIHGTNDEIVNIKHGVQITKSLGNLAKMIKIEGASHNDIQLYTQSYIEALNGFLINLTQ